MHQKVQVPIRTAESHRCLPRPINPPDGYFSLQLPYGLPSGFQPYAASMNLPQKDEMKYLRNDSNLMNICFGCGKRYKWRDSLLRHQRVECGNKEKKFCCKLCPKKFYHQYKLNEHYQGRHKIPKSR